jgi:hypothetical protein
LLRLKAIILTSDHSGFGNVLATLFILHVFLDTLRVFAREHCSWWWPPWNSNDIRELFEASDHSGIVAKHIGVELLVAVAKHTSSGALLGSYDGVLNFKLLRRSIS